MPLRGNLATIRDMKRALRSLPKTAAAEIAKRAQPELTRDAGRKFDAGLTVYGRPREPGVDGNALRLVRTGATRRALRFAAVGTTLRIASLPRYAKYLFQYGILPPNGAALPREWQESLAEATDQTIKGRLP